MKRTALNLIAIFLVAYPMFSQVVNVPADQPSIQAAIEIAEEGDTVLVEEGTYLENINFLGKAITVASHFILDDDTAHISRTVIDGSQPAHPDTASVVTMWSGEDTTSILMGFTLTGGNGTYSKWDGDPNIIGGAVLMLSSGGKICSNIIEENHTNTHGSSSMIYGGTLFASVDKQHRAIIRENVIRNNTTSANWYDGGCIFLNGGGILLEANQIINNTVNGVYGYGAGIAIFNYATTNVIEEVIVRNNIISGNSGTSSGGTKCDGGGIFVAFAYKNRGPEIYNNIITGNSVDGMGGGIAQWWDFAVVYNNTIFNNEADRGGNNIAPGEGTMILFNNILGADEGLSGEDIAYRTSKRGPLVAHHNVLKDPLNKDRTITSVGNIVGNPVFETDSFALSAMSPGIGWGLDSLQIDGISYQAPLTDFRGSPRPHPIDNRMDIGAMESHYEGFVYVPDTAFLNGLIEEGVDTDEDGLISFAEAKAVKYLNVNGESNLRGNITDMTGIEAFVNLEELRCSNNPITFLDVSNNTELRELFTWHNPLTALDVSKNTALTFLVCNNNPITKLDLSNNPNLERLSCTYTQLTSLDVSNHIALTSLHCWGSKLTSLIVSGCTSLIELSCFDNQITSLDISSCILLESLWCVKNQLSALDISENTGLTTLLCGGNQLSTLDASNNTALEKLSLSYCEQLFSPPWDSCFINNNLTRLDLSKNIQIEGLNLGHLPHLEEVCVWESFDRDLIEVDTTGSPNVFFTTECHDYMAPNIIAIDTLYQPDYIEVTSSIDGVIYLVPEDTDKDIAVIRGMCIDSVLALANTPVDMSFSGLDNGIYWLYARGTTGNISEPEEFIIMGVSLKKHKAGHIRIYPNPTSNLLTIETAQSDHYSIEITSLNGQQILSGEMEGNTHQIDLSSFQKGVYFITIRSKDFVTTRKIIKL